MWDFVLPPSHVKVITRRYASRILNDAERLTLVPEYSYTGLWRLTLTLVGHARCKSGLFSLSAIYALANQSSGIQSGTWREYSQHPVWSIHIDTVACRSTTFRESCQGLGIAVVSWVWFILVLKCLHFCAKAWYGCMGVQEVALLNQVNSVSIGISKHIWAYLWITRAAELAKCVSHVVFPELIVASFKLAIRVSRCQHVGNHGHILAHLIYYPFGLATIIFCP